MTHSFGHDYLCLCQVRDSYVAIAKECFGKRFGPKIVSTAQLIELLMTCILYIVLCGDLMIGMLCYTVLYFYANPAVLNVFLYKFAGTFPDSPVDSRSWMMICGMFLLPVAFLRNLHHVSTFSFWCTVAHLLVNFIIVAYCLACIGQWSPSEVNLSVDLDTFPISLGIIVFSYTSHIFLPTLEGNMMQPEQFNHMLDWSHIAAAAFKSGFGYLAFLTWQKSTLSVITNNLPTVWKSLVNVILVLKAVLSFPLPYYAAVELLEKIMFPRRKYNELIWDKWGDLTNVGCMFRVMVVIVCILSAVLIPHFGILMGFIGNFTGTMLSFIWPCYFHLKLKGNSLHWKQVAFDCFIIFLGCSFAIIGIYDSGKAMVEAFAIGLPF